MLGIQVAIVIIMTVVVGAITKEEKTEEYLVTSATPIVHEDLGVVLLPARILAQSTENIFQSVFMTMPVPPKPSRACDTGCNPNVQEIKDTIELGGPCWIQKMAVVHSSIVEVTTQTSVAHCFAKCLINLRCGLITYDDQENMCTLQTGKFYSTSAIDESSTSSSARLECLLENAGVSRAELCKNENLLFTSVLNSMTDANHDRIRELVQKYEDVKQAYDLSPSAFNSTRRRRGLLSWDTFDFLSDVPI